MSQLKAEGVEQRRSLAEMAALMEGLTRDKGSLSHLVLQVRRGPGGPAWPEPRFPSAAVSPALLPELRPSFHPSSPLLDLGAEGVGAGPAHGPLPALWRQLELVRAARRGLQRACDHLEEGLEGLEGQAARLRHERAQLQEQVGQVRGPGAPGSQPHPAGPPLPLGRPGTRHLWKSRRFRMSAPALSNCNAA